MWWSFQELGEIGWEGECYKALNLLPGFLVSQVKLTAKRDGRRVDEEDPLVPNRKRILLLVQYLDFWIGLQSERFRWSFL